MCKLSGRFDLLAYFSGRALAGSRLFCSLRTVYRCRAEGARLRGRPRQERGTAEGKEQGRGFALCGHGTRHGQSYRQAGGPTCARQSCQTGISGFSVPRSLQRPPLLRALLHAPVRRFLSSSPLQRLRRSAEGEGKARVHLPSVAQPGDAVDGAGCSSRRARQQPQGAAGQGTRARQG